MSQQGESQNTPDPKLADANKNPPPPKPEGDDVGEDSWDEKTKGYVSKLRNENKERRQELQSLKDSNAQLKTQLDSLTGKLKGLFGEEGEGGQKLTPDQQIEALTGQLEHAHSKMAFIQTANNLGIYDPADQKYFEFLLESHFEDKEDDYELSDEALEELVADVQARSKGRGGNGGNSSFSGQKTPPANGNKGNGETTLEQFKKMGVSERSELYVKNEALYLRLMQESKNTR